MPLDKKTKFFKKMTKEILEEPKTKIRAILNPFDGNISDFPKGEFLNLETLRFTWIDENWFEYIPDPANPFSFRRSSGEAIQPGRLYTDGGSIPRVFWWKEGLSPWEYAPAYLVHDWEFDLHHSQRSQKPFEEVRDIMMEAVRTLMESPLAVKRKTVFSMIYDGIDSIVARKVWDKRPGITLP